MGKIIEAIKLLFKVRAPAQELAGELKSAKTGWNTLAWWASILTTGGAVVAALAGFIPAVPALIATTVATCLYQIVRMLENMGQPGITPLFASSRFWVGLLGIISGSLIALKSGGINPVWLDSALSIIGVIMTAAQNIGATQPEAPKPGV